MKFLLFFLNFKISRCNHGVPRWKRLRSAVDGNQHLYVPIAPKPVAAVVLAPCTTLQSTSTSTSTATAVATPTNYQLSASRNVETESRTLLSNLPALDLSSSLISVAQAESTPASQNSGHMVTETPLLSRAADTILPFQRVNLLEKSIVQGPLSISGVATRPEAQSSDNTVAQSQLAVSSIVSQSAPTSSIHHSVRTNSLPPSSQRINSSVNMIPSQQLPPSDAVSQVSSTIPFNGSFSILSQRQLTTLAPNSRQNRPFDISVNTVPQRQLATLATNPLPTPSQLFNSSFNTVPQGKSQASSTVPQISPVNGSFNILPQGQFAFNSTVNIVPQGQLATNATGSQPVAKPVRSFVSGNSTLDSQTPRSTEDSDESIAQLLLNLTDQELETCSQMTNEAIRELHASSTVSDRVASHASSRVTPSPGLSLLTDVVGEAQREQWENSIASAAHVQVVRFCDVGNDVNKLFLNCFSWVAL